MSQIFIDQIMNKILNIINEEIDRVISENIRSISMLLEQDPNALPPAAPAAAAPAAAAPAAADPAADPAAAAAAKEFDVLKTAIVKSADIKTDLQNAFQEKSPEERRKLYDKLISDKELLAIPNKIAKIKDFIAIYSKDIKKPSPPLQVNAAPKPVAESKMQKSIKEYLHYKRLYNRIGIK